MKHYLSISVLFAVSLFTACGNDSPTSSDNNENNPISSSSISSEPESSANINPESSSVTNSESKDPANNSAEQSSSSAETPASSATTKEPATNYDPETGLLTDKRDGEVYKTTKIGEQVWMAENLRYLPTEIVDGCDYRFLDEREKPDSLETYGRTYSWVEATRISCDYLDRTISFDNDTYALPYQGICPDGWHVPELEEWKAMIGTISNDIYGLVSTNWTGAGFAGTEKYGFNVLPPANHTHVPFIMINNYGDKVQTMVFDDVGVIQLKTSSSIKSIGGLYLRCLMD